MVNEDRVKKLYKVAVYEQNEEKEHRQAGLYYRSDYIGKEVVKSFFTGTFAFAGLVVLWMAINAEDLINRINDLDFKSIGITIGVLYVAFLAVYIFVTIVVYASRYKAGRKEVHEYMSHLKEVGRIYSREEKIKR